jgi:four helix bundle protein
VVARSYTDLYVWKVARALNERTLTCIRHDGFAQHLWLKSQMAHASHSACANIAEGFGRYKPKDFARFLRIARGSLLELNEHLRQAHDLGLIAGIDLDDCSRLAARGVAGITRLIRYLESAKEP